MALWNLLVDNTTIEDIVYGTMYLSIYLYDNRFVFASNCHATGLMTDTEWHLYCDWHSYLAETLPLKFDAIVYLRTDPKVHTFVTCCSDTSLAKYKNNDSSCNNATQLLKKIAPFSG